jgi:cell wall-associated NlpC family hydrolase
VHRDEPRLHRPRAARLTALLAAFVCVAGVLTGIGSPAGAPAAALPSNPSDNQINHAQAQKTALANQVGQLTASVAQMQAKLNQLKVNLEIAEQRVALALQKLEQAKEAAAQAAANVVTAQKNVDKAQNSFNGYMQQLYMGDPVTGTTGALLTSGDPSSLLQRTTLEDYQSEHQISAIGDLQTATVAKSNADAQARATVLNRKKATDEAKAAKDAAAGAFAAAKSQEAQLQAALSQTQTALDTARLQLETLNNQRDEYLAWQRQVARQQERLRERAAARQAELLRKLREQQQQQQQNNGGGGGGGVVVGGGGNNYPGPPTGGSWSQAKGNTAVARAARWLGMPYIWAGGDASGPTSGGCTDPIAPCGVVGFDCSGLTLNAWAPFIGLDHFANTQYFQAGRFHPQPGQFLPGDLLFWGNPGAPGGLHHVAIYAGNGMVIQAPESGDIVRYTQWDQVSYDYYGATRPLT